jgi:hypothetical protein
VKNFTKSDSTGDKAAALKATLEPINSNSTRSRNESDSKHGLSIPRWRGTCPMRLNRTGKDFARTGAAGRRRHGSDRTESF